MKGCRQHASPKCKNLGFSLSVSPPFPVFLLLASFWGEGGIESPFPPIKYYSGGRGKCDLRAKKGGEGVRVNQRTAGRSRSRSRSRAISRAVCLGLGRPGWHLVPLPRLIPKNILVYIYPSSLPPSCSFFSPLRA